MVSLVHMVPLVPEFPPPAQNRPVMEQQQQPISNGVALFQTHGGEQSQWNTSASILFSQHSPHHTLCEPPLFQTVWCAFFRQKFTLEDAIGSHACSLEASRRVTNGIPLGWPLLLPVDTVNCVQTLKVLNSGRTPINGGNYTVDVPPPLLWQPVLAFTNGRQLRC